jgi:hypothetical protein
MGKQVHRHGDDIHVSGALTVAKQCTFDTVCASQNTKFCVGNSATTVVVRMQGQ